MDTLIKEFEEIRKKVKNMPDGPIEIYDYALRLMAIKEIRELNSILNIIATKIS